ARSEVQARRDVRESGWQHPQRHCVPGAAGAGLCPDQLHVRGVVGPRRDRARLDRPCPRISLRRPRLETGVTMNIFSAKGFSIAETVVALGVLTTGILGA